MLSLCAECEHTQACQQLAADAPFMVTGVWGGLVLGIYRHGNDRHLLPEPTRSKQYPSTGRGHGSHLKAWEESARNYLPAANYGAG